MRHPPPGGDILSQSEKSHLRGESIVPRYNPLLEELINTDTNRAASFTRWWKNLGRGIPHEV